MLLQCLFMVKNHLFAVLGIELGFFSFFVTLFLFFSEIILLLITIMLFGTDVHC
jgi:hypothetical protein